MTKRNELGQFLPNDQLEPLIWVKADASGEDENEVKQEPCLELRGGVQLAEQHRSIESALDVVQQSEGWANVLAQHTNPQTVALVNDAGEEVVLIGVKPKKLDRNGLPKLCSRCKVAELDGKDSYCKECRAEYMRERRQNVGLTTNFYTP